MILRRYVLIKVSVTRLSAWCRKDNGGRWHFLIGIYELNDSCLRVFWKIFLWALLNFPTFEWLGWLYRNWMDYNKKVCKKHISVYLINLLRSCYGVAKLLRELIIINQRFFLQNATTKLFDTCMHVEHYYNISLTIH